MKSRTNSMLAGASLMVMLASGGCATNAQTGTLGGAGIGALAGQAIGGDTGATLIGAGIGALVGHSIGQNEDEKEERQRGY